MDGGLTAELISDSAQRQSLSVVNLSTSGTAFLADEPLASVDEDVVISLCQGGEEQALSFKCRICYIIGEKQRPELAEPRWLHGTRFHGLGQAERLFIERVVAERGR